MSKANLKGLGSAIARQRKKAGFTQAAVAERLGLKAETISRIETGAITVTVLRLLEMGELFNCGLSLFFDYEDPNNEQNTVKLYEIIYLFPLDKRKHAVSLLASLVELYK